MGILSLKEKNLSCKGLPVSFHPDVTSVEKPKIIHESLSYKSKIFYALNYHAMWTYLIIRRWAVSFMLWLLYHGERDPGTSLRGGWMDLVNRVDVMVGWKILVATSKLGARGSVVGWGTTLQAGRSPDEMDFFNSPNPSSRTMALGLTQTLTEMSTRKLPGIKSGRRVGLTTLPPSVSWRSESVGASTSRNPEGLHGLSGDNFTFYL
jgi:hypothetical protein